MDETRDVDLSIQLANLDILINKNIALGIKRGTPDNKKHVTQRIEILIRAQKILLETIMIKKQVECSKECHKEE